tara:strand:+ start:919 stop:1425 length:507 start_codon:yes stop_codon:yes gene_type:complete
MKKKDIFERSFDSLQELSGNTLTKTIYNAHLKRRANWFTGKSFDLILNKMDHWNVDEISGDMYKTFMQTMTTLERYVAGIQKDVATSGQSHYCIPTLKALADIQQDIETTRKSMEAFRLLSFQGHIIMPKTDDADVFATQTRGSIRVIKTNRYGKLLLKEGVKQVSAD